MIVRSPAALSRTSRSIPSANPQKKATSSLEMALELCGDQSQKISTPTFCSASTRLKGHTSIYRLYPQGPLVRRARTNRLVAQVPPGRPDAIELH